MKNQHPRSRWELELHIGGQSTERSKWVSLTPFRKGWGLFLRLSELLTKIYQIYCLSPRYVLVSLGCVAINPECTCPYVSQSRVIHVDYSLSAVSATLASQILCSKFFSSCTSRMRGENPRLFLPQPYRHTMRTSTNVETCNKNPWDR